MRILDGLEPTYEGLKRNIPDRDAWNMWRFGAYL